MVAILVACIALAINATAAEHWPQFRWTDAAGTAGAVAGVKDSVLSNAIDRVKLKGNVLNSFL